MEGREVGGDDVFFVQSPTYTVHRILRGMSEKPHHGLRGCATHPDVVQGTTAFHMPSTDVVACGITRSDTPSRARCPRWLTFPSHGYLRWKSVNGSRRVRSCARRPQAVVFALGSFYHTRAVEIS